MSKLIIGTNVGILIGFIFGIVIAKSSYTDTRQKCEINLPRSEQCVQVFVPQSQAPK